MARKTDEPVAEDLTGPVEEAIDRLTRHANAHYGPERPKVLKPGEDAPHTPSLSVRLSAALDRALLG